MKQEKPGPTSISFPNLYQTAAAACTSSCFMSEELMTADKHSWSCRVVLNGAARPDFNPYGNPLPLNNCYNMYPVLSFICPTEDCRKSEPVLWSCLQWWNTTSNPTTGCCNMYLMLYCLWRIDHRRWTEPVLWGSLPWWNQAQHPSLPPSDCCSNI